MYEIHLVVIDAGMDVGWPPVLNDCEVPQRAGPAERLVNFAQKVHIHFSVSLGAALIGQSNGKLKC